MGDQTPLGRRGFLAEMLYLGGALVAAATWACYGTQSQSTEAGQTPSPSTPPKGARTTTPSPRPPPREWDREPLKGDVAAPPVRRVPPEASATPSTRLKPPKSKPTPAPRPSPPSSQK